jgi:uncharacterized membrane protein
MHLIPSWAPNLHPLVIHFPIVLIFVALLADGVELVHPLAGLQKTATALYALGAVSALTAVLTGGDASHDVFIPGMAGPLVEDHQHWAIATTIVFIAVALVRGAVQAVGGPGGRRRRVVFFALSVVLAVLVQQTAERGARLVYQQGVGVVAGPGPGSAPDSASAAGR